MKKNNAILVFLISTIAITGLSVIDGYIWDIVFLVVGMIAYCIVGILFSIGILYSRRAGKDAYALVFFMLIFGGYAIYRLLEIIRTWILSWPYVVKIIIPTIICSIFLILIVLIILYKKGILFKKNDQEQ